MIELLFRAFSTNSLIQDLVVFLRIRMFSVASMSISTFALSAMSSGNVGKPLRSVSLYFLANMETYLSTKSFLSLMLSLEKRLIKLKRERSSAGKVSSIFPRGAVCREHDDKPAEIMLHPLGVRERSCLEEIEEEVPDGGFSFLELVHQENSGIG